MQRSDWLRDLCALAGLALIGSGCWLVSPALAMISVGGFLLVAATYGTLRGGRVKIQKRP